MIIFKILLALLSSKIATLFGVHPGAGLLVGGVFGHILDQLAYRKFQEWKYRSFHTKRLKAQAGADFLFCFFTLAGKICLADGSIAKEEQALLEKFLHENFKYKRHDRKLAIKYFKEASKQKLAVQTLTSKIVELLRTDAKGLENTVLMLKQLASADGKISQEEYAILFTVSSVLGFEPRFTDTLLKGTNSSTSNEPKGKNNSQSNKVEINRDSPLEQSCKVLGCKPQDSITKIKQCYREMVSKYHPDKISGKELPQDFIDFAHTKFQTIQSAYEVVKKERGF